MNVRALVWRTGLAPMCVLVLAAGCAGTAPGWTPLPASVGGSTLPSVAPSPVPSNSPLSTPGRSTTPTTPTTPVTPVTPATPAPSSAPSSAVGGLIVTARDLSFSPRALTADAGTSVTLSLHNAGRIVHNLTIDELGVQVIVSPGMTGSVTLPAVAPGTYTFYCSVSGHRLAGMFGTLTVK